MSEHGLSKNKVLAVLACLLIGTVCGCRPSNGAEGAREAVEQRTADEMEESLQKELLNAWYPIALDTLYGGFLSDFTFDWRPSGPQNKMIVTQSRHVWTTSKAALFFNDSRYLKIAGHGFRFLEGKMWDPEYGGFTMLRNRQGGASPGSQGGIKTAYGNAFAIYALTAYYEASGDTSALGLAQRTFGWLDRYSRDPRHLGYVDQMARDGSWLGTRLPGAGKGSPALIAWKDQNSSIHLLEAFSELFRVWPDSLLRRRILELLTLIRDTITTDKGALTLFMDRDWTPISFRDSSQAVLRANVFFDHVSFGHDVETAYLMLEASRVLGLPPGGRTLAVAKRMVDHALAKGWDGERGGFYDSGSYPADSDSLVVLNKAKVWWAQAEGLNALLLMAKLFPHEKTYERAFRMQWAYMKTHLIDHEHGGWYEEGLDNSPDKLRSAKGSDWKVNYHESRALMNCIRRLRSKAE